MNIDNDTGPYDSDTRAREEKELCTDMVQELNVIPQIKKKKIINFDET